MGKVFFTFDFFFFFFKLNYIKINCGISGDSAFRNMKYIENVLCFCSVTELSGRLNDSESAG